MAVQRQAAHEQVFAFGSFQILVTQKLLLDDGRAVAVGRRALDILIALIERAGEVVSKRELMAVVWPDSLVEESNLRVHITALRKILGDRHGGVRYLVNVTGRGYSFIGPVERLESPLRQAIAKEEFRGHLPSLQVRVTGRDKDVDEIVTLVARRRFVTIVGAGGVGKTTVALAAAERLATSYTHGAYFIDLGADQDPSSVALRIASALGVTVLADNPTRAIVDFLRSKRVLVLFDSCERAIAATAQVIEKIRSGAPSVDIIATSRESLLAEEEHVYLLSPLECPPDAARMTAASAMNYPAVRLFTRHAIAAALDDFELSDDNAPNVAAICRRLDGMPLALELVAPLVSLYGIDGLSARLDQHSLVPTKGRRTAVERHQSLRAMLDWSYQALLPDEKILLQRLAVFKGSFDYEAAIAVASGSDMTGASVLDRLMSLISKSLVAVDASGSAIGLRLLQITRSYVLEKCVDSLEWDNNARRHAEHYRGALEQSLADWDNLTRDEWIERYGRLSDNVRNALDWAFGTGNDSELGAALTVASLPFNFATSNIDEFLNRAMTALDRVTHLSPRKPLWEIRLLQALGSMYVYTGAPDRLVVDTFRCGSRLAQQLIPNKYTFDLFIGVAASDIVLGNYSAALDTHLEIERAAKTADDAIAILLSDRIGAQANHFGGNHERARVLADRVLSHPAARIPLAYQQVHVNRAVSMRIVLARVLWLEGFSDQADQVAREATEHARRDAPGALCLALAWASCPVAFWRGDVAAAKSHAAELSELAKRHAFNRWLNLAECYDMAAMLLSGGLESTQERLSPAGLAPRAGSSHDILCTIVDHWIDEAAIQRAERGLSGWCTPELLRVAGARQFEPDDLAAVQAAESKYISAIAVARDQKALAWELRAATSLARLRAQQGRRLEAVSNLEPVLNRICEGQGTADVRTARALLADLRSPA